MSTISNISGSNPLQQIASISVQKGTTSDGTDSTQSTPATDKLELSGVSQLFQTLQTNNVRTDLVQSVKSQIDNGTYETDDKLNSAIDKLLNDLN